MTASPRTVHRLAQVALLAVVAITLSGAAVRLTGSGLGCSDWPRCSQQRLIDVSSYHAAIEQLNRLFTGVIALATVAALVGALIRRPRRADLVRYAAALVGVTIANAVLGGISVLIELHPVAIQGHMLLSLAAVSLATAMVIRSAEPDEARLVPAVDRRTNRLVWVHYAFTWVAVGTGTLVTAAGPHAGDEHAARLDVAISSAARVHSVSVLVTIALAVYLAWTVIGGRADRGLLQPLRTWIVIGILQAIVGYVQYFSNIPPLLVEVHILGAVLVMWASTVLLLARRRPVNVRSDAALAAAS